MATMQAQNYFSEVFDTDVPPNAMKCIVLGCSSAQMATGRKHLDGFSAPSAGQLGWQEITRLYGQYKSSRAECRFSGGVFCHFSGKQIEIRPLRRSVFSGR